jgi:hypothetical protein
MPDPVAFDQAKLELLHSYERKTSMCAPFMSIFPVTGASVSVLGSVGAQTTICASDNIAAHLDELQFDLGEGPCWEAMTSHSAALHADIQHETDPLWPEFADAIRSDGIGAMFAFPLLVSSLEIGAVDLYCLRPGALTANQVAKATELAQVAAWQVLRRVLDDDEDLDNVSPYSRREVHQATGMVIAQLHIGPEDASLLLRAHAFSSGRSVREIASDVVERRLDFRQ